MISNEVVNDFAHDLETSLSWNRKESERWGFSVVDYEETVKKLLALGYTKGEQR